MRLSLQYGIVRSTFVALLFVMVAWLLLGVAQPVQAAGVVTDCSNDTQLRTMLSAGGDVSFNCNGNNSPATIIVSPVIGLASGPVSLDGGNKVTLSAANTNRIFYLDPGPFGGALSVTLTHIVLTNGYGETAGGCIYMDGVQVLLDDVTLQNCRTESGGVGGGIYLGNGGLTLKDSRVLSNTAGHGGGVRSIANLTLMSTLVAGNRAIAGNGTGGGLEVLFGQAVITGSTIYSNTAEQDGGGLYVGSTTNVSVMSSQINGNRAMNRGGGIYSEGTLSVRQSSLSGDIANDGGGIYNNSGTLSVFTSTLSGNAAAFEGGGVTNYFGTASLSAVTLSGNSARYFGGGIHNWGGTLYLTNAILNGNSTTEGGGIMNSQGSVNLTSVTLSGNKADFNGGGIENRSGTVTLTNVTLSDNAATLGGGIANFSGAAALTNVTLSGNAATEGGGGIWQYGSLVTETVTLRNSIVANSPSGGNCYKEPGNVTPITSNNFNLSSDNTCTPYFNQSGDWNNQNANLSPLGNHGGTTLTHVPFPPSKAVDGGSGCPSPDQRGVSRPQGLACDIGAVEYVPGEKSPWLWLPLIRR